MNTEVEVTKSFDDRMKDKIRESIGDLITDEELSKIVAQGIHAAFFEPVSVDNSYSRNPKREPLITNIVKELLSEKVNLAVKGWFKDNPEAMTPILDEVIKSGITKTIFNQIDSALSTEFITFGNHVIEEIKRMFQR